MFGKKKKDDLDSPSNSSTPLNTAAATAANDANTETPVVVAGGNNNNSSGAINNNNNSTNSAIVAAGGGTTPAATATLSTRTRLATPWQYPLYGFIYLFTSPSMICSVICAVSFGLTIAITSLILLFVLTLQTQAEALTFGKGGDDDDDTTTTWWSYLLAVFAVLFEATLITLLLLNVVHKKSQKKIFVTTMKQEKTWRDTTEYPDNPMIEPGGIELFGCLKLSFIVGIITFPLHVFLPLVGTIVYALLNSRLCAWELMDMYFNAINMDYKQQRNEVRGSGIATSSSSWCGCLDISSKYVQFGFVCGLLESIPIVGPTLFPLTNACGAALWSADMEKQYGGPSSLSQQQHSQQQQQ